MSSAIEITFVNNSHDMNNSSVVIFQKNVATSFDELAVAWKVIKNCGRGWEHKFQYPFEYNISASNTQMQLPAINNHQYEVIEENSRSILISDPDKGENSKGYTLINNLPFEVIDADVYKDGSLIAKVPHVAPQQKAIIEIPDLELCIAIVNFDIDEGNLLPADFVNNNGKYTTLNLNGIEKTAIVYTTDENGNAVFSLEDAPAESQPASAE